MVHGYSAPVLVVLVCCGHRGYMMFIPRGWPIQPAAPSMAHGIQEPEPITPPTYGHSMLFQRFDGQWMMSVHSHAKDAQGRTVRIPHFFEVDLSGDKLVVK